MMNQTDHPGSIHIPKILVVCDRSDTAPIWGYILRQKSLIVILEAVVNKAIDRWQIETPDLVVVDVEIEKQDPILLCRQFRGLSTAPILLFLPAHHETHILDAYAAGVDDVVVKPISPAIFQAKVMAWIRRSWTMPINSLEQIKVGKHWLDASKRCLIKPDGCEIQLTNLEFRLLYLLMSRPDHVFHTDDIVQSTWSEYGNGDPILLKNVVYRLRKKIETDPNRPTLLHTEPGGYSFQG